MFPGLLPLPFFAPDGCVATKIITTKKCGTKSASKLIDIQIIFWQEYTRSIILKGSFTCVLGQIESFVK